MKIYVATVEALRKKGKTGWMKLSSPPNLMMEFHPHWMLMYFCAGFSWISPCVWPNSGFRCCVFSWISPCVWPNSGFWCCVCLYFTLQTTLLYWDFDPLENRHAMPGPWHKGLNLPWGRFDKNKFLSFAQNFSQCLKKYVECT